MAEIETLHALLATSDPEVLETMKRAFDAEGFEISGEAWPGIEAARRAASLSPDVVLLHIEEPLEPAVRTVSAIAEACPAAGLAVLSSSRDMEVVRRVMNAGANDFASLPLSDDALRDAARRATGAAGRRNGAGSEGAVREPAKGRVIAVAGPRGGVGKTMLAANLAATLARETKTAVALADLDMLFGGAAIALDMMPRGGLQDWLRARANGLHTPVARYLWDHSSGLRLLAAPPEPDSDLEFTATDVVDLLTDLSTTHEFVVVDTAPSFNEVTAAAIEHAPLTLLVTSPEVSSVRAVRTVVETLRGWKVDAGRLRLVLNHPTAANGMDAADVREALGMPVGWTLPHDRAVLRASAAGVPLCDFEPRSRMAREIRKVARFVAGVDKERPARRRLLGVF